MPKGLSELQSDELGYTYAAKSTPNKLLRNKSGKNNLPMVELFANVVVSGRDIC